MDKKQMEAQLAEAVTQRDRCNALYRETRDMADERETLQGKEATMRAAMRYKAQAEVWGREVCSLTAQLAADACPATAFAQSFEQRAAVDETIGALAV